MNRSGRRNRFFSLVFLAVLCAQQLVACGSDSKAIPRDRSGHNQHQQCDVCHRGSGDFDPNTDQFVVVAAGIGRGGTVAAGEFLVDQQRMGDMLKPVPEDWNRKNLEIVLETPVIEGRSGPPRISAIHTW